MDEQTDRKIRDLRLKLMMVDKELNASQHKTNLGAMLRAGNPAQMTRAADRDRKRLEEKREKLMEQLVALDPSAAEGPLVKPSTRSSENTSPSRGTTIKPGTKTPGKTKAKAKNPPEQTA